MNKKNITSLLLLLLISNANCAEDTTAEENFCLPPEADRSLEEAVDDTPGTIMEQPKFGCAVILCLSSPQSTPTCTKVINHLYSSAWLFRTKPKWPSCSGKNIKTVVKPLIKVEDTGTCKLTAQIFKVKVYDNTIENFQKENNLPVKTTRPFFNASIPSRYSIKKSDKEAICDQQISWKAIDARPQAKSNDIAATTAENLANAPVCKTDEEQVCVYEEDKKGMAANEKLPEEERLPICKPTCIDKEDKKGMAANEKLPEEERLPACGDCDVDSNFLKKMLGKDVFFTANNMSKYPNAYRISADTFTPSLNQTMSKYGIKSCYAKAHFLAQTFHEAAYYNTAEEYASGKAYEGRKDLGNTRTGDGKRFKGRGLIQLTGRHNYTKYGRASNPQSVAASIAIATDASGYYWTRLAFAGGKGGCASRKYNGNINNVIKSSPKDVLRVTKCINGGTRGLSGRKSLFNKIIKEWGIQ